MPQATNDNTKTRRYILSALAAAPAVALPIVAAVASTHLASTNPDAGLLALVKAHNDLDAEHLRVLGENEDDPRVPDIIRAQDDLAEEITAYRAMTLEGVRAKVSAALLHTDRDYAGTAPAQFATPLDFMVWSLADDLARLVPPRS